MSLKDLLFASVGNSARKDEALCAGYQEAQDGIFSKLDEINTVVRTQLESVDKELEQDDDCHALAFAYAKKIEENRTHEIFEQAIEELRKLETERRRILKRIRNSETAAKLRDSFKQNLGDRQQTLNALLQKHSTAHRVIAESDRAFTDNLFWYYRAAVR